MKPTAQRAQWGEGVSPRQAFAARVEEQREAAKERLRRSENVRRRQLGMAPVEPPQELQATTTTQQDSTPRIVTVGVDMARPAREGALTINFTSADVDRLYRVVLGDMTDSFVFGGRRESPEERRRKEEERKAADERAKGLLREAGTEGALLASGEAAIIPSQHCPDITYALVPEGNGMVHVFRERLGHMGHICIQAKSPTPPADVLLTRLMLCKHHEEELWRTGNFFGGFENARLFLPKTVRDWMPKRRANQWEFMPMGLMNWGR